MAGGSGFTLNENDTLGAVELRVFNSFKTNRGSSAPSGTITLGGTGTDVITNSTVQANAIILLSYDTLTIAAGSETIAAPAASINAGIDFTIISAPTNTSIVNYFIINP